MNREEVIAVVKKAAKDLGQAPTLDELVDTGKLRRCDVRRHFGTYREVLKACELERSGSGYGLKLEEIFLNWASVARQLGKVPSVAEYQLHGKQCAKPAMRHFGVWAHVPAGMVQYARERGLQEEWKDVLELVARHSAAGKDRARNSRWTGLPFKPLPRIIENEAIYGPPTVEAHLIFAPTNEQGVIFLFGAVARQLGFVVLRIQTGYPDGEAMREIEPERWQRVKIEFEYESRNFLRHGHTAEKCHLIVCWRHNWPECPLEVIELRAVVEKQM